MVGFIIYCYFIFYVTKLVQSCKIISKRVRYPRTSKAENRGILRVYVSSSIDDNNSVNWPNQCKLPWQVVFDIIIIQPSVTLDLLF